MLSPVSAPSPAPPPVEKVLWVPNHKVGTLAILLLTGIILYVSITIIVKNIKCNGRRSNPSDDTTVNPDIETGMATVQIQPQPNLFVQVLANFQWNAFHHDQHSENSSELIIQMMRTAQVRASPSNELNDRSSECGICLEIWEDKKENWILPRCKHKFHTECICKWVKSSGKTCPVCRRDIVKI
ncbi:hypothetical protein IFM89_016247 [Coptis chinensis]|uniref:RING-type domain-containing protein n=1 Tax=Coptis chinensis TaxID=261450 RepID=A0A835I4G7_9MAGN|nr:hypothetical protein IFM89_016247 [Coptis chinensis]